MAHIPVNHHLRPVYRSLATAAGLYVLAFGVAGFIRSRGTSAFSQGAMSALGLQTNLAFSIASFAAGVLILLAVLVGRNVDYFVNLVAGVGFLAAGIAMMALLRTDMNVLNFSIATCIVSFVIGMVLFSAGLYGKVGSIEAAATEEALRHGGH